MLNPLVVTENSKKLVQLDAGEPAGLICRPLFGLDTEALAARMVEAGEPPWRGRQLAEALYRQRIGDLDAITTLPKLLRQRLAAEGWEVGRPRIGQVFQSVDGTERYLVQCQDNETVEAVWMPEAMEEKQATAPARRSTTGTKGMEQGSAGSGPQFASPARWVAPSTASSA